MFDLTKPFTTRTGLLARILCTDTKNGRYPIAGLMSNTDGQEYPYSLSLSNVSAESEFDPIPAGESNAQVIETDPGRHRPLHLSQV